MSIDLSKLQDVYVLEFYSGLNCPRSLACWILYKYGEHKQLTELQFDPDGFSNLSDARDALAATKFLSKATFLSTNVDTKAVAMEKFLAAESICKETNFNIVRNRFKNPCSAGALMRMRSKIERILGRFNPEEFLDSCNWGPGATTLLARRVASHPKKFSSERKITRSAYDFVSPWFHSQFPLWEMTFEIDGASKIVTVPKDAKSDRTIAIEPGLNLFFQKGIGAMIRRRLKRVGIDLDDQGHNQRLARLGSKFNKLATVDFSSASDTICYELVREILPMEWFSVLNSFRSEHGLTPNGDTVYFSKFSSMGNGFTFELESLIFLTMAEASCEVSDSDEGQVSVYGDDVIIPSGAYETFASISRDLGFSFNLTKSYRDGYYRESCGEHFWNGERMKPIFQKDPLNDKTNLILAANNVRRLARSRRSSGCDLALRRCYRVLTKALGPECPRISEGYGDVGLIENLEESKVESPGHGYEGYFVRVWAVSAAQRELTTPGLLLFKLKGAGSSRCLRQSGNGLSDFIDLESTATGNKIPVATMVKLSRKRLLIPKWDELGPWY